MGNPLGVYETNYKVKKVQNLSLGKIWPPSDLLFLEWSHCTLKQTCDIILGLPAEPLVTSLIDSLDLSNCDLVLIGESSEIVNDVCQDVSCYRTLLDNVKPFKSGE